MKREREIYEGIKTDIYEGNNNGNYNESLPLN